MVDGQDAAYFRTVCDYIHHNPVRAGLLAADAALQSFVWSSFPMHVGSPSKRPRWLKSDWVLGEAGETDTGPGRRSYRIALEKRAVEEIGGEAIEEGMLKALRRGWCFSSEEFRAALVEKTGKKDGSVHTNNGSAIKRTHDEQEAERLIAIGLKALGISAVDLPKQPKSSTEKIALASVAR